MGETLRKAVCIINISLTKFVMQNHAPSTLQNVMICIKLDTFYLINPSLTTTTTTTTIATTIVYLYLLVIHIYIIYKLRQKHSK